MQVSISTLSDSFFIATETMEMEHDIYFNLIFNTFSFSNELLFDVRVNKLIYCNFCKASINWNTYMCPERNKKSLISTSKM